MVKNSRLKSIFIVTLSLTLMAGLIGVGQADTPKKGGTIIEAIGTEPTNLDCFKARRRPELTILHMIIEPLFVANLNLQPEPLLVESWEPSADNKIWTFTLKKGLKFHDGTPVNAAAVKFSMEKHKNGSQAGKVKTIESIEVVDELTFKITCKKSNPLLTTTLCSFDIGIVSPTAYENDKDGWGSRVVVGSGPLMFKEWRSGDRVVLVRNPDYAHGPAWLSNRGPAYVDEWVIRFLPEPATLIGELTAGEVDLSDYVTERDAKRVEANSKTSLVMAKSTSAIYLAINCSADNPPFDDVRVRQALAHAVSAEAVRKAAMAGVGYPLYTSIAPTAMGFNAESETVAKPLVDYNPELAKKLLDEAGWKDTNGDGIRDKDGVKFEFTFSLPVESKDGEKIATLLKEELAKVGVIMHIEKQEWALFIERVHEKNFDATTLRWMSPWSIDLYQIWHSSSAGPGGSNAISYSNPEVDRIAEALRSTFDEEERIKLCHRFHQIVHEEQPYTFLFCDAELMAVDKRFEGVETFRIRPGYELLEWWVPRALQRYP